MTIAAIGLNLTLGYAGQISLAQAAFVGIGAYTAALLTTQGWPLGTAFLVAPAMCFAIGWLLGYPALRVQHHYLAFVTLAFTTLVFLIFRNEEWLTKGVYGISGIPRPTLLGWSTKAPLDFYLFSLGVLALVTAGTWWLVRSPWGRAFMALRENAVRVLGEAHQLRAQFHLPVIRRQARTQHGLRMLLANHQDGMIGRRHWREERGRVGLAYEGVMVIGACRWHAFVIGQKSIKNTQILKDLLSAQADAPAARPDLVRR